MQDTQSPQLADLQFTSLLSSYNTRNLTTFVGNEQQVWTAGPGGSADAKLPFTITVQLRIVSRRLVLCTPPPPGTMAGALKSVARVCVRARSRRSSCGTSLGSGR